MKKETYKTDHPTIKEISIGDQFFTYDGEIVTFVEYHMHDLHNPFKMFGHFRMSFDSQLTWLGTTKKIKYKILSIKDKLDLL